MSDVDAELTANDPPGGDDPAAVDSAVNPGNAPAPEAPLTTDSDQQDPDSLVDPGNA